MTISVMRVTGVVVCGVYVGFIVLLGSLCYFCFLVLSDMAYGLYLVVFVMSSLGMTNLMGISS